MENKDITVPYIKFMAQKVVGKWWDFNSALGDGHRMCWLISGLVEDLLKRANVNDEGAKILPELKPTYEMLKNAFGDQEEEKEEVSASKGDFTDSQKAAIKAFIAANNFSDSTLNEISFLGHGKDYFTMYFGKQSCYAIDFIGELPSGIESGSTCYTLAELGLEDLVNG